MLNCHLLFTRFGVPIFLLFSALACAPTEAELPSGDISSELVEVEVCGDYYFFAYSGDGSFSLHLAVEEAPAQSAYEASGSEETTSYVWDVGDPALSTLYLEYGSDLSARNCSDDPYHSSDAYRQAIYSPVSGQINLEVTPSEVQSGTVFAFAASLSITNLELEEPGGAALSISSFSVDSSIHLN